MPSSKIAYRGMLVRKERMPQKYLNLHEQPTCAAECLLHV